MHLPRFEITLETYKSRFRNSNSLTLWSRLFMFLPACADCVVRWGEWSECESNRRTRTKQVTTERIGTGLECPELETEAESEYRTKIVVKKNSVVLYLRIAQRQGVERCVIWMMGSMPSAAD